MAGDGAEVGFRVGHPGRQRNPDQVGDAEVRQPLHVVQDHPVVDAGPATMRLRVHELEVEQHQIAAPRHAQEVRCGGEPGGAEDDVQTFQPLYHRFQKLRLHERFATREAYPAIGEQRRLAVQEAASSSAG